MDTFVFFIALIAVVYIVIWAIRNDDLDGDEPTQGFFRMIDKEREQSDQDAYDDK